MHTIDTLIERLKQLRDVAPDGGNTPVTLCDTDSLVDLVPAALELQAATPVRINSETSKAETWKIALHENTHIVVSVF